MQAKDLWDLKVDDEFMLVDGATCRVLYPTEDGQWIRALILDGDSANEIEAIYTAEIKWE